MYVLCNCIWEVWNISFYNARTVGSSLVLSLRRDFKSLGFVVTVKMMVPKAD